MERKKKEEKLKQKAEKEARKVGVRQRDATATTRTNGVCKDEHNKNNKQNNMKNVGGDDDNDEKDAHNIDVGRNGGGVGVGGGLLCLYGGLAAWKVMSVIGLSHTKCIFIVELLFFSRLFFLP